MSYVLLYVCPGRRVRLSPVLLIAGVLSVSGLAACGGGGGSPTAATPPVQGAIQVTVSPSPVPFSGAPSPQAACAGSGNTWRWIYGIRETGGAIEMKELPFVMGVLGDFTGQPEQPLPRLRDRKFVEVNPDNFDQVLEGMKPHLSFSVENKLSEEADAAQLKVDLHFKSMDDFSPENVARQVKPLRELLDLRTKLSDLRGSLQGNDKLDEILQATLADAEKMARLKTELGTATTGTEGPTNG